MVHIQYPHGPVQSFQENTDGTFSLAAQSHDTLVKNADGSFDMTKALSNTKYHFTSAGLLETITDDYGNSIEYTYDGNGRLTRISDGSGSGRYMDINYGPSGRISSVQDSAGRLVQYLYNPDGTLQKVINAVGIETTYIYTAGRFGPMLSQIWNHLQHIVTAIYYHPSGNASQYNKVSSYREAEETYNLTYGSGYTTKSSTFGTWTNYYGADGRVTKRVPPSGQGGFDQLTSYYSDGSVQMETDEAGVKTYFTYNPNGSVATITRDYQGTSPVLFEYAYDANFPGKVISITPKNPSGGAVLPDWQAWKYDYYQSGSAAPGALHHVYRVQSDGLTLDTLATYTYNSSGQVLTVTDAGGSVTTYAYNITSGDLESVTYPKNSDSGVNPVYSYGRDSLGRVISVTDPLGKTTTYTYDHADRVTSVTLPKPTPGSPLNFTTTYSYDHYDGVSGFVYTHQTDPNGKLTKQGYDRYGQMVRSVDALGNITTFNYSRGLLASIVDSNNNTTSYNYNGLKRLTSTVFPNGTTESYTYTTGRSFKDENGQKKSDHHVYV